MRAPAWIMMAALAVACGKTDEADQPERASAQPSRPTMAKTPPGHPSVARDPIPPAKAEDAPELVRADGPLPTAAEAAEHLGFAPKPLAELYAVEGIVKTATWGAPGENATAARDDDLDTAWTCQAGGAQHCAWGLSFTDPTDVKAIRFYAAAGPAWRDYTKHPRIAKLRVHTDHGHVDLEVKDGAAHRYVVFETPIETKTLTLEVLEVHEGAKKHAAQARIHLAEVEVYGTQGRARSRLDLDPDAVFVRYETEAWKDDGGLTIRQTFLEQARPGGDGLRLMRGTALLGRKGDRWLLVEKLHGGDCGGYTGSYVLLDQQSRMVYPLGPLGQPPAEILRQDEGQGFAVPSDGEKPGHAIVIDEGVPKKIGLKATGEPLPAKFVQERGYAQAQALPRGGYRVENPPKGCVRGTEDTTSVERAELSSTYGRLDPAAFAVCDLEGGKAVIGTGQACGKTWSIVVLGPDGARLHEAHGEDGDTRGVRLQSMPGVGLVVETSSKHGGRSDLHRVSSTGIEPLAEAASLAVRPPPRCQSCDDRFRSPEADEADESDESDSVDSPGSETAAPPQ